MIRHYREIAEYMRNPKGSCAASAEIVLIPLTAIGLCKQGSVVVISLFMWGGNFYGAETHYAVAVCDPHDCLFDVRRAFIIVPTFGKFGIGGVLFWSYSAWMGAIRKNSVFSRKLLNSKIYSCVEADCRVRQTWVCAADFEGDTVVDKLWGNQLPAKYSSKKTQACRFDDIFEHKSNYYIAISAFRYPVVSSNKTFFDGTFLLLFLL